MHPVPDPRHTDETAPIWWSQHPLEPTRRAQRGESVADLLIVGAGLAGVATALVVAQRRPSWRIVLAEANRVGAGATGRSTGIVGPGLSAPLARMRRRYGDEATSAAFEASLQGVAELRWLLGTTGVDCDARTGPHLLTALTARQEQTLRRHAYDMADLGFPANLLATATTRERLGGRYRAALRYDDVVLVDPYRLVTGLATAAEQMGVLIVERSPVLRLDTTGELVQAQTPGGTIAAPRLLLAVDGYAGPLNPHRTSVLPIRTHVVATEPLSAAQLADLDWNGRGAVIDQRNYFNYYRLGAGDRLLFGGGPALVPSGDPRRDRTASGAVFERLERQLVERFPALRATNVEARWSGLTGATLDRLPVVGPVRGDSRVHFAGGWCGHGLSLCLATAAGYGRWLAGDAPVVPAVPLPWWRGKTAGLPSRPLRSVGLPMYLRALDWQDRVEAGRAGLGIKDAAGHGGAAAGRASGPHSASPVATDRSSGPPSAASAATAGTLGDYR